MILDCFTFFNELDMLEGRLKYLYNDVDYFVIVEANHTHSGKSKPLNFLANIARYKPYLDKILYFPHTNEKLNELDLTYKPQTMDSHTVHWYLENCQRNHIMQALKFFPEDTLVMISDCDEIPSKHFVNLSKHVIQSGEQHTMVAHQMLFYNNFNYKLDYTWYGTVMTTIKEIQKVDVQWFRNNRGTYSFVWNGGWHLSYWGSAQDISYKIQNFAHQEYNKEEYTDVNIIKERIQNGVELFNRSQGVAFDIKELEPEIHTIFSKYIKEL